MITRNWGEITYTFVDHEKQMATHTIQAQIDGDVTAKLAAYQEFAKDYLALIYNTGADNAPVAGDLSQCACMGYTLKFMTVQDASVTLTSLAGDSEDKSLILYRNVNGFPLQGAIPGCVDALQAVDGVKVLTALDMTQFTDLTTALIDGQDYYLLHGGFVFGCDSRGERIASVTEGYKQQRGSTKKSGRRG